MYLDLLQLTVYLRLALAFNNLIIFIWSTIWFIAFWRSFRRRGINGPTIALMIKFVATCLFHSYLFFGFLYLANQSYVTPGRTIFFLIWGWLGSLGIIIAYAGLQWKIGGNGES
jgi:hypothetical protein